MMPTPLGLPYPLPADPVSAGAADIRALAEAVDALLDDRRRFYMVDGPAGQQLTAATYTVWPSTAVFSGIAVPSWATHALVTFVLNRAFVNAAGSDVLKVRPQVGANFGREHVCVAILAQYENVSFVVADEIALGALAGTTTYVQLAALHGGSVPYGVDSLTRVTLDLEFIRRA
jgi:hypothetical protein